MQSTIEKVLIIFLSCYQVSIVNSSCSTVNLINHLSTFCETQDSWNVIVRLKHFIGSIGVEKLIDLYFNYINS